ncbi:MAG: hypothetical protein DRO40_10635 [Thermoprotei archaeon]|nr:MAG: hypothetical protein DRO40_10635 [Thermoprotei archaeon]
MPIDNIVEVRRSTIFRFGVESLDKYYADALIPGTSILIAGHPGAGKTTFAATICYVNALEGNPCLFISFGEFKEKFYRHMSSFNMDFKKLENEGMFKYVKLPLITTETALDNFVNDLIEGVEKHKARVIVIDGITPLLQIFHEAKARAFLQTVLYDIPRLANGILVLVADLPFGEEKIGFGGIDFVADIVIVMKHRVSRGLLVRTMELRKFRGAPINIAEIPFRIVGGIGIHACIPPSLKEISVPKERIRKYEFGVEAIDKKFGGIESGSSILIEVPSLARNDKAVLALLAKLITVNRLKTVIVSYLLTKHEFLKSLKALKDLGINYREVLKYIIGYESLNPAKFSIEEIYGYETNLVERLKPDLVVYMGGDIVGMLHANRKDVMPLYVYNKIVYNKLNNVTTVWIVYGNNGEITKLKESLANHVIKVVCKDNLCIQRLVYLWSNSGASTVIFEEDLLKYIKGS